jgi:hypothetical protein
MIPNIEHYIKGLYIIYMFNYFKTTYSLHHPWEQLFTGNISNWLQHPIKSGQYENKICPFGNIAAFAIAIWFIVYYHLPQNSKNITIHKTLLIFILIISLVMNLNAFLYFLPLFIYEFIRL